MAKRVYFGSASAAVQHVKDHLVGFHRCCVTFSSSQMIKIFEKQCTFCVKKPFSVRRHADSKRRTVPFFCVLFRSKLSVCEGRGRLWVFRRVFYHYHTSDLSPFSFIWLAILIITRWSTPPRSKIPATGSRRTLQERCGKFTVSFRKPPEIAETWKQYFGQKLLRFFLMDSCKLPVFSGPNRPEIIGRNPKNF